MDGVPCRGCGEDCGERCLSLQRARARERDAAWLSWGPPVLTVKPPRWSEDFL